MVKLKQRLRTRPRIVTDALAAYLEAVEHTFGSGVDYTMMTKEFRTEPRSCGPFRSMGNYPTRKFPRA